MRDLVEENVQDYPRPPILDSVPQRLRVVLGGETIADSIRALRVLETHHAPTYYIPPEDVTARLFPVSGNTYCEWKGRASYFDVEAGGKRAERAAWSYRSPTRGFSALEGHLAFYASAMDACFVGEHRVVPQPGDFYGGWVTDNLTGRIKGAAGTEHW